MIVFFCLEWVKNGPSYNIKIFLIPCGAPFEDMNTKARHDIYQLKYVLDVNGKQQENYYCSISSGGDRCFPKMIKIEAMKLLGKK